VEEILGLKIRSGRMRIDPVIPREWKGFQLRYRYGDAVYEIHVENPDQLERGVAWMEMDGQRLTDLEIPLDRSLIKHRILVHMGKP
jgi:cyclic beta-1,2-glucan synthetase